MNNLLNELKQKKTAKPKGINEIKIKMNVIPLNRDNRGENPNIDLNVEEIKEEEDVTKLLITPKPKIKMVDLRKNVDINRELIMNRLKNQQIHHIVTETNKKSPILVTDSIVVPIHNPNKPDIVNPEKPFDLINPEERSDLINPEERSDLINPEKRTDLINPVPPKKRGRPKKVIDPINNQDALPAPPTNLKKPNKTQKKRHLENVPNETIPEEVLNTVMFNNKTLKERLPNTEEIAIKTSKYYMNNRKLFIEKMSKLLRPFKSTIADANDAVSCSSLNRETMDLFTHQKIVKEYLNLYTPYRGLLLYHGLGSGKTCTSIAIAEGMKTQKQIILMTPASLKMNYFSELKRCGDFMYKKNQHWDFINTNDEQVDILSKVLHLSPSFIRSNGGAWLVDSTIKTPNYSSLSVESQNNLDEQLNLMIRSKYIDINYNSSRIKEVIDELTENHKINPFDNKTIIIDEAHNFVSRIVNKIKNHTSTSYLLYKYLMGATNAKIVLLTGTPIINYPNELGVLFNILRGYIKTWTIELTVSSNAPPSFKINKNEIIKILNKSNFFVYDYINFSGDKLTITRNPFGFVNTLKLPSQIKKGGNNTIKKYTKPKNKTKTKKQHQLKMTNTSENENSMENIDINYQNRMYINPYKNGGGDMDDLYDGVKLDETGNISDEQFISQLKRILSKNHIDIIKTKMDKHKSLPDEKDDFIQHFFNSENKEVKNINVFKKRILGLTSYFRSADEKLLPEFVKTTDGKDYHIVQTEMSEYQFSVYEKIRKSEAEKEKHNKTRALMKKNKDSDLFNISSTYRVYSREACNFAFPDPPGKPSIIGLSDIIVNEETKNLPVNDYDLIDEELSEDHKTKNQPQLEAVLNLIKHDPSKPIEEQYLILNNLGKYSPKFKQILENIINPENRGLHLLYSQFRSVEGIGILKLALEANGFVEFKLTKRESTDSWTISEDILSSPLPKFVLYTGTETSDEKEIIRNIYNSNWDMVPSTISTILRRTQPNNFFGEIVKVLMITASGSEGINLKNTRFVHIVEPYWNLVRIEQVIGRARRICSHQDLPDEFKTVKVFLYLSIFSNEQKNNKRNIELMIRDVSRVDNRSITTDENLYELSILKTDFNNQLLKAVKETSMDCSLYYSNKNKENIVCYNFGKITSNTFSSMPTLEEDMSMGETDDINVKTQKQKIVKITVNNIDYAFDQISNILYSYESYLNKKEGHGNLEEVGKVVKEGTKYKVILN